MTVVSFLLKLVAFILLVLCVLLYFFQSKLLFHPTKLAASHVFKFSTPFEEKFISYEGKFLHGLLFRAKNPKARILYFHGNGGALDTWGDVGISLSEKLNSDILLIDYPGYGKSSGKLPTTEKELFKSGEAAFDELIKSTKDALPIIIYGRSLGTGVASYIATQHSVQGLVLESPYVSIKSVTALILPFIPAKLIRYNLDNAKNIQGLKIPILIFHGTEDGTIPYSQGKQLAASKPEADFVPISEGGHNNLSEHQRYWEAIEKFMVKVESQQN
jgi:hypothetical protein